MLKYGTKERAEVIKDVKKMNPKLSHMDDFDCGSCDHAVTGEGGKLYCSLHEFKKVAIFNLCSDYN